MHVWRSHRSNSSSRRGAAATELAVLLPFLGLMFSATLDFGRVYYATQTIQECAISGALFASGSCQTSSSTGASAAATAAACATGTTLSPPLQAQDVSVTVGAATATVTVTYTFQLVTPVLGHYGQITLQRSAVVDLAPMPGT